MSQKNGVSIPARLDRKEGAQNCTHFCLPFFLCALSLFFFSFEGAFFESPLSALLIFYLTTFLAAKTCFIQDFSPIVARALFPPAFFFLLKAPSFFIFYMEGCFLCALFSPSFFFAPSALFNLVPDSILIVPNRSKF